MDLGLYGYVGCPRMGKTTLAREHWMQAARDNDLRLLCIDSTGARNLADIEHAPDLESTLSRLYTFREAVARTPADQDELDALLKAVHTGGKVSILFDEFGLWKLTPDVAKPLRTWYHPQLALFLTTQYMRRDFGQLVQACNPRIHLFRTDASAALDFFLKWRGIDPDTLRTLAVGKYFTFGG